MQPIPPKVREQLEDSAWMKRCRYRDCPETRVEWNHALKYQGRKVQTWYALIPLCTEHHRGFFGTIHNDVKLWCEWLAIMRGQKELDRDCPKWDWRQRKKWLDKMFI